MTGKNGKRNGRKNRNLLFKLLCAGLLALPSWNSLLAASANTTVGATVLGSISSSTLLNLNFGEFTAGPVAGTVILTPSGTRSSSGGVSLSPAGISNPAMFSVTGNPNATYTITLPSSLLINDNFGNSMTVSNFGSLPANNGQLSAAGQAIVSVGGTLNVPPNQPMGGYNSIMVVTLNYY